MVSKRLIFVAALLGLGSVVPLACGGSPTHEDADVPIPIPEGPAVPFAEIDFKALPEAFPEAIKQVRAGQPWSPRTKALQSGADASADPRTTLKLKMTPKTLEESYDLGQQFLVNWQVPEGNFRYMYDWISKEWIDDDHQVRQAGSLCPPYRIGSGSLGTGQSLMRGTS